MNSIFIANLKRVDAKCKLCHTAPETRQHFLAECSAYASERETLIEKLRNNPVLCDEIKSDFITETCLYNIQQFLRAVEMMKKNYFAYFCSKT